MSQPVRVAAALLLPALATVLLSGCGGPPGLAPHQRAGSAASPAALRLGWSTPASQPDWVPADATRIRWIASTQGGADRAPAVLRVSSESALPASCTADPTAGTAAISASWAPRVPPAAVVHRCGNWGVTTAPGGYFAWTPASQVAAG